MAGLCRYNPADHIPYVFRTFKYKVSGSVLANKFETETVTPLDLKPVYNSFKQHL